MARQNQNINPFTGTVGASPPVGGSAQMYHQGVVPPQAPAPPQAQARPSVTRPSAYQANTGGSQVKRRTGGRRGRNPRIGPTQPQGPMAPAQRPVNPLSTETEPFGQDWATARILGRGGY